MKILFIIIISLLFYSCQDNGTADAPGSGPQNTSGRQVELTSNLDIYYCYYPGYNEYRPLGNNPLPSGPGDLINAFTNLDFSRITVTLRIPPDIGLNQFSLANEVNLRLLIKNYEQKNSIANREYDRNHIISISRDINPYTPYGVSFNLKLFIVDTVSSIIRRS